MEFNFKISSLIKSLTVDCKSSSGCVCSQRVFGDASVDASHLLGDLKHGQADLWSLDLDPVLFILMDLLAIVLPNECGLRITSKGGLKSTLGALPDPDLTDLIGELGRLLLLWLTNGFIIVLLRFGVKVKGIEKWIDF